MATDPNLLHSLSRKHAIASHKLMKADTIAAGEDFERKRAWDWTIDESEKWDRRMQKKEKHKDDVAFQDYRQDARKVYKRQMRDLKPDIEAYEKEKAAAVQRAAESGGLELVETEDGELIAVDKDGTFYSTANSTSFVENRPDKAKVDALVSDIRKAEEVRLRKRRERARGGDDGDITYINEKNKVSAASSRHLSEVILTRHSAIQPETPTVLRQVYSGDQGQLRKRNGYMILIPFLVKVIVTRYDQPPKIGKNVGLHISEGGLEHALPPR